MKKYLIIIPIVFFSIFSFAKADTIVSQTTADANALTSGAYEFFQTLGTGFNYNLEFFQIRYYGGVDSAVLDLQQCTTSGYSDCSTVVSSANFAEGGSWRWSASTTLDYSMDSNKYYRLRFVHSNSGGWSYSNTNTYANGTASCTGGGDCPDLTDKDYAFVLYGTISTPPKEISLIFPTASATVPNFSNWALSLYLGTSTSISKVGVIYGITTSTFNNFNDFDYVYSSYAVGTSTFGIDKTKILNLTTSTLIYATPYFYDETDSAIRYGTQISFTIDPNIVVSLDSTDYSGSSGYSTSTLDISGPFYGSTPSSVVFQDDSDFITVEQYMDLENCTGWEDLTCNAYNFVAKIWNFGVDLLIGLENRQKSLFSIVRKNELVSSVEGIIEVMNNDDYELEAGEGITFDFSDIIGKTSGITVLTSSTLVNAVGQDKKDMIFFFMQSVILVATGWVVISLII